MQECVSIVIRALNEEKWLDHALSACKDQRFEDGDVELILVDSGSTDRTIEIAERHGCRIVHIKKTDFTFGRSLNYGCEAATGNYLVFISAHCIPANDRWLAQLIAPLRNNAADYAYGRQVGHEVTRFSEHQIFAQHFPNSDMIPQEGFFINNANAAIRKKTWANHKFDETVTGLEDMVLGKAIVNDGGKIGYVAEAAVIHIHEESFRQTQRRYYREALTLRGNHATGTFSVWRFFALLFCRRLSRFLRGAKPTLLLVDCTRDRGFSFKAVLGCLPRP